MALDADLDGFPHDKHVREENLACINCHDPHGSQKYPHMINFLIEINGVANVTPISGETEPIWVDEGLYRGSCTLFCHGEDHRDENY